ncbi:MAG: protein-L-isoaspartate(D-aspartate) O-methyltransferase [Clostridia bacterium]|nr:protein-L-isoaspartate(D-aspartate) O-methyltransferase [Clostridia bacterium]
MENSELYNFFKNLDRSAFIDNEYKKYAHYNEPLPIGHEQTISQPTMVYHMTSKLDLNKQCKVLEIGTGSGYQTAFLAEFAGEVYTIERIESLSVKAQERLNAFGYTNIKYRVGDGSEGWREFAPYDRIIATAAAGRVPDILLEQLGLKGKMLIPVGKKGLQELFEFSKKEDGSVIKKSLGEVVFVEFKGQYGWKS